MRIATALFLAFVTAAAAAQQGQRHEPRERQMSKEDRQRMRDDMRDAYRSRGERPQRQQMSPEQREKLRRDIQDANKDLKR
jgi:hypothetical protein